MSHPQDREPPVPSAGAMTVATPRQQVMLAPMADAMMILAAQKQITETIGKILTEGIDYGPMPGAKSATEKKRMVLFKAGAERVLFAFDVRPEFTLYTEDIDHDRIVHWRKRQKVWNNAHRDDHTFRWEVEEGQSIGVYRYVVRCQLIRRSDGMIVGEGYGSCSTMESKYVDRPRDSENTALKIAKKRAMVDATLTGFALSDRFTQDVEEATEEAAEVVAETSQPARRLRREPEPDDWTPEDRARLVALAEQLHYDGAALKRVIRGLLGHYPPKTGEEVGILVESLTTEVQALSESQAAAAREAEGATTAAASESSTGEGSPTTSTT
jgi:hypothetical protein